MPHPLPVPIRQNVFRRWQAGERAVAIALALDLHPRTVQRLVQRFRRRGADGVHPAYRRGVAKRQGVPAAVFRAALAMRHVHPRWGAPLIRVLLGHRFPRRFLVCARTLQRWFRHAGLGPPAKGNYPAAKDYHRADKAHEGWQMDAAEQLTLHTGEKVSWLEVVDEHTGAVLDTTVFPEGRFNQVPAERTQTALRKCFTIWGLPGRFRVDNGPPWGSKGDLPTDLALWLIGLGVELIWNPPRRPQRNGVVERFQGVEQCWAEPESCCSVAELQRKARRMNRLQREEYPLVGGKSRLEIFPELAHSGRNYNLAWEKTHWNLAAVADYLARCTVPRQVDRNGSISLYNRSRHVGKPHAGKTVWVTFDPQVMSWIISDSNGNQIRQLSAPEISRERIMALAVSNKRPEAH